MRSVPCRCRQTSQKLFTAPYRAADFTERLREIDMFFQGNDRVHETMHRVAQRLESAGIPYAIVGGMAVNAHGHQRTTGDVDFLLTSDASSRSESGSSPTSSR